MTMEDIASVCHEANRAYCATIGDYSQVPWMDAPKWQRESAVKGVHLIAERGFDPEKQHEAWIGDKLADGWRFGAVKDDNTKRHPCIVPYNELPSYQKAKDALFGGVVVALLTQL